MPILQPALSVLLVLSLLGGALWWLRRKGMASFKFSSPALNKRKSIRVVERLALTPQHSLHLVKVEERTLLIAASPAGCSLLESLAGPPQERMEIR
jgi:flagellar biosynthetic protein FliO